MLDWILFIMRAQVRLYTGTCPSVLEMNKRICISYSSKPTLKINRKYSVNTPSNHLYSAQK